MSLSRCFLHHIINRLSSSFKIVRCSLALRKFLITLVFQSGSFFFVVFDLKLSLFFALVVSNLKFVSQNKVTRFWIISKMKQYVAEKTICIHKWYRWQHDIIYLFKVPWLEYILVESDAAAVRTFAKCKRIANKVLQLKFVEHFGTSF